MIHPPSLDVATRAMPRPAATFGEPSGPWSGQHTVGAAAVFLIVSGIGLNIWPGWHQIAGWLR